MRIRREREKESEIVSGCVCTTRRLVKRSELHANDAIGAVLFRLSVKRVVDATSHEIHGTASPIVNHKRTHSSWFGASTVPHPHRALLLDSMLDRRDSRSVQHFDLR